jgi:hypothetical protein
LWWFRAGAWESGGKIFVVAKKGSRFVWVSKGGWVINLFVRIRAITSMGEGVVL